MSNNGGSQTASRSQRRLRCLPCGRPREQHRDASRQVLHSRAGIAYGRTRPAGRDRDGRRKARHRHCAWLDGPGAAWTRKLDRVGRDFRGGATCAELEQPLQCCSARTILRARRASRRRGVTRPAARLLGARVRPCARSRRSCRRAARSARPPCPRSSRRGMERCRRLCRGRRWWGCFYVCQAIIGGCSRSR